MSNHFYTQMLSMSYKNPGELFGGTDELFTLQLTVKADVSTHR